MATGTINETGQGERRWFYGGGTHVWKVTEAASDGTCSAFEDELTEGKTTPWHAHPTSDELTYLLSGTCRVKVGDDERIVEAGGSWFVPRGTPHGFLVLSPAARILAVQVPGSAGRFYWEASEPAGDGEGPLDFARIGEVAAATGVTDILGPPPFS